MMYRILCISFVVFGAAGLALGAAQASLTDEQISSFLIGAIVTPPDSADYDNSPSNQVFNTNGLYSLFIYEDKSCSKVKDRVTARWQVRNGILISTLTDGRILRDEVLEINGDRIKLRSLDDGQTYLRRKAAGC